MSKLNLFGAALVAALLAGVAQAEPLTFDAALAAARNHAPSLRAKTLGTDSARAARGAAGALPDPKLALGVDSFPISGPLAFEPNRDNFTWARVGLSQDIPNAAKRHAQQARADTDIAAAEAETIAEARTVEIETAIAWITLAYAERRLAALEAVRARLERLVRTAPSALSGGSARPAQTLAGRQALAALEDRRDELVSAVARARAVLTRWTGDPSSAIDGPVPEFTVDPVRLRAALERNPVLASVAARVGQADADVRLAEAQRRPDFGVDVSYQRRDPRFGDYVSAGVTIGLPLFQKRRQNPLIAARAADAAKIRAEQDATARELAASLDAGLADHVMHHAQWMRAKETLEPLARERVDLETASYAAGRAGLLDVVDANGALATVILDTLDREALVAIDGARLALTYGSDIR
ncbi:TolC family protein [Sphingomonas sp. GB1N7]|uniref:TolC family protein n=1 Tax=Parasphingomonas caseinilytica TaxID=3096158 RepID=UPI002FCAE43D